MKKIIIGFLAIISLMCSPKMMAQEFFDTSDAPQFITFGGRIGFNTSNRTFPVGNYSNFVMTSWGTGFNLGAQANFNFKEYLSVQPGLFFESRSSNLINIVDYYQGSMTGNPLTHYEIDHLRAYYFTIPVMGIVKFNLAKHIKWLVEFGPYLQICLKETGQNNVVMLYRVPTNVVYDQFTADQNGVDFGFKMGSGLKFFDHYYIGFHYLEGVCNAWKMPSGGRNKSWMFTVGYDF